MARQNQLQAMLSDIGKHAFITFKPWLKKLELLWHRVTHLEEASFRFGCELIEKELYEQAKFRFKFVLWRRPRHTQALYNLAICHLALNETGLGIAALNKVLAIKPQDESALFLLASVSRGRFADPGTEPHTTPVPLIRSEFSVDTREYDDIQLAERGYKGVEVFADQIDRLLPEDQIEFNHILDAGCGTGLVGAALRPFTAKLTGIDLTPEMLAIAKTKETDEGRPLYDELLEEDVRTYLLHLHEPHYDLIVLAEVAELMGGLSPLCDGAMKALLPGGLLVFTIQLLEKQGGYHFDPETQRFRHSSDYLKSLSSRSGLIPLSLHAVELYEGETRYMVVMQKPVHE